MSNASSSTPPAQLPSIWRTPGFEADMKRLLKNFKTLEEDLETFIAVSVKLLSARECSPEALGVFPISREGVGGKGFYIVKKYACRSLKGKGAQSGIRIVLRWQPAENKVVLVEMFNKNEKEVEDLERIRYFLKGQ
jgi:hypothetical protein